jgi:thiamine-phosphate pyrophosphorylase
LDGAYIPSFNKKFNHLNYSLKTKFEIVGSSHNIKEIRIKETQKVKKIFISSLFKRNKNYLGLNKFKLLCSLTKKQTIALGGISKNNLTKLRLLKFPEFAGISYFKE